MNIIIDFFFLLYFSCINKVFAFKETIVNQCVLRIADPKQQEVRILDLFVVWKEVVEF